MIPAPWHYWPMAALAVVWHLIAAADYLLTKLGVSAYMAWFTPGQIAYFTAMPLLADITWAIGVWFGALGALLLCRRHHRAPVTFALSFFGFAVLTFGLVLLRDPPLAQMTGALGVWLMLAATGAGLVFYLYARAAHARGWI